jgi:hypothetical protein
VDIPAASTPIVCDMTDAPDTSQERLAEYQRLFTQALIGRERTPDGIRFRFRAEHGIEAWVRDLAAREKACCAFFAFTITTKGDEVLWDAAVTDNGIARAILDEFYVLPDTVVESLDGLRERFAQQGLDLNSTPAGTVHHLQHAGVHTGSYARRQQHTRADPNPVARPCSLNNGPRLRR